MEHPLTDEQISFHERNHYFRAAQVSLILVSIKACFPTSVTSWLYRRHRRMRRTCSSPPALPTVSLGITRLDDRPVVHVVALSERLPHPRETGEDPLVVRIVRRREFALGQRHR